MRHSFRPTDVHQVVRTEVLVVGAGAAGLVTALSAADMRPLVISKATLDRGASSLWAQGGIAAAVGRTDSPKLHADDTLAAGAGISDPEVTRILTEEARAAVELLARIGTRFDLDERGRFLLSKEAAHQRPRVLHANQDATGAELMRALAEAVRKDDRIQVHEETEACELVVDEAGSIAGLLAVGGDESRFYQCRRVVVATGGLGQLYQFTTNPPEATGDGLAMAARAGVRLTDVEFVQFHPTALHTPNDPLPLVTEAVRGAGARLVNDLGIAFLTEHHELGDLAPRDVVARGVWAQLKEGRTVYLDAREVFRGAAESFPNLKELCNQAGIDPAVSLIPVVPAAHFHMGGIDVDLEGRTSLQGLWACGEVSSTGVHGANRLASNSLLEAVVFGGHVARSVMSAETSVSAGLATTIPSSGVVSRLHARLDPKQRLAFRQTMWDELGLVRSEESCLRAEAFLQNHAVGDCYECLIRCLLMRLMIECAKARRESRGAHYRSDFPEPSSQFQHHSRVVWDGSTAKVSLEADPTEATV